MLVAFLGDGLDVGVERSSGVLRKLPCNFCNCLQRLFCKIIFLRAEYFELQRIPQRYSVQGYRLRPIVADAGSQSLEYVSLR